jgi:DNA-directed RNA polymerase specialized sigma24 family protein
MRPPSKPDLERLAAERSELLRALAASTQRLRAAVRVEYAAGVSKVELARRAGVSRVTVDAWLRR